MKCDYCEKGEAVKIKLCQECLDYFKEKESQKKIYLHGGSKGEMASRAFFQTRERLGRYFENNN